MGVLCSRKSVSKIVTSNLRIIAIYKFVGLPDDKFILVIIFDGLILRVFFEIFMGQ
jgi:hypothetical protein